MGVDWLNCTFCNKIYNDCGSCGQCVLCDCLYACYSCAILNAYSHDDGKDYQVCQNCLPKETIKVTITKEKKNKNYKKEMKEFKNTLNEITSE